MKINIIVALCLLFSFCVLADPDYSTAGAILGAAAGLVVGNNSSHIDQEYAVPLMAAAGALLGQEIERKLDARANFYQGDKKSTKVAKEPLSQVVVNRQPGVDLVKISIHNSNGITTDIPIIRLKDKFVGPQGEIYETLPSADELAKKYGM